MQVREFNQMDEISQAEVLLHEGVLVAERAYKGFNILLYQVGPFYVEAYFNNAYNIIQGFRAFKSLTSLDPYLEEIDISPLQHC
jgi:hypothetical protein